MNFKIIKKIQSFRGIKQSIPLSFQAKNKINRHRKDIINILRGIDKRLLIIIGPCSAWPKRSVLEYANRLKELSLKFDDKIKIIMRVYSQKPRTKNSWIGSVNQPNPLKSPNNELGMKYVRQMMVQIVEIGLPVADELLFVKYIDIFGELLSWAAVGARNSESQEHRLFSSLLDFPIGIKNPIEGSLQTCIDGILVAQYRHIFVINGYEIETCGNSYSHIVLRGNKARSNCSTRYLQKTEQLLSECNMQNKSIIIDTGHDNCLYRGKKSPMLQSCNILRILNVIDDNFEISQLIKGFMVESYLKTGSQNLGKTSKRLIDFDGLSITDPCLGWNKTEYLLSQIARKVDCDRKH